MNCYTIFSICIFYCFIWIFIVVLIHCFPKYFWSTVGCLSGCRICRYRGPIMYLYKKIKQLMSQTLGDNITKKKGSLSVWWILGSMLRNSLITGRKSYFYCFCLCSWLLLRPSSARGYFPHLRIPLIFYVGTSLFCCFFFPGVQNDQYSYMSFYTVYY